MNGKFVPLNLTVLAAGYLVYLELALMVAVALMFSSFSTPMLSALFSFAIYVIGHFSRDLLQMAVIMQSALSRAILKLFYYLLPNLSNFSFITEASHERMLPLETAVWATLYAVVYISILLAATVLIFQKKNFK